MSITSHADKFSAPRKDAEGRIQLVGLSLPEMQAVLSEHALPNFRSKQTVNGRGFVMRFFHLLEVHAFMKHDCKHQ